METSLAIVTSLDTSKKISTFDQSTDTVVAKNNIQYGYVLHSTESSPYMSFSIFNSSTEEWEADELFDSDGDDITARIGHSFNIISSVTSLVFGGELKSCRNYTKVNDLYQCSLLQPEKNPNVIYITKIDLGSNESNTAEVPDARAWHGATVVVKDGQEQLFMCGGVNSDHEIALADIWCFKPQDKCWYEIKSGTGNSPLPLAYHTCTYVKESSSVIVVGGKGSDDNECCVHLFNTEDNSWSSADASDCKIPRFVWHTSSLNVDQNRLLILGGTSMDAREKNCLFTMDATTAGNAVKVKVDFDTTNCFVVGRNENSVLFIANGQDGTTKLDFCSSREKDDIKSEDPSMSVVEVEQQVERDFGDNATYNGEWNGTNREGRGTFTYADTSTYEGEWLNDKRHGKGTFSSSSIKYDGMFEEDLYHGLGKICVDDLNTIEGEFVKGEYPTYGVIHDYNGTKSTCSGSLKNLMPHGDGRLENESLRELYVGKFFKGKRKGYGKFEYADGSTYEGEWNADERNGIGTYFDAKNRSTYYGKWIGGVRCGKGKCTYANKHVYAGFWKNDVPHGVGKVVDSDGKLVEEGIWRDGKLETTKVAETNDVKAPVNELRIN